MPMDVSTLTAVVEMILVASSLPPMPHSTTAMSQFCCAIHANASTVSISNAVGTGSPFFRMSSPHATSFKGEPVTKDVLNELWHELNVQYYGPDMRVDDEISYEWMRIPHFYTPYYVYQYSTGYSAAVAFSKKILEEGKPAVDKYIGNFLCGGCSKNPIELLKSAGVDMSTPKPVDDALNVFEDYLKQFETATK